jgi:hypothetical protein
MKNEERFRLFSFIFIRKFRFLNPNSTELVLLSRKKEEAKNGKG